MQSIAQEFALLQHVHEPTRGKYLLDLVLSDLSAKVSVLPMIADHNAVLATFDLNIPASPAISRYGWCYKKADWGSLRYELEHADWSFIFTTPLDNAVCKLEQKILDSCLRHIPRRQFMDRKQEHPWLNDACRQAIRNKHMHENESDYSMHCNRCSEVLLSEYHKYIAKIRKEMQALPRGSKKWWKMNSILLHRKSKSCSIPALRDESGTWILDAQSKANLFADVWSSNFLCPYQLMIVGSYLHLQILICIMSISAPGMP